MTMIKFGTSMSKSILRMSNKHKIERNSKMILIRKLKQPMIFRKNWMESKNRQMNWLVKDKERLTKLKLRDWLLKMLQQRQKSSKNLMMLKKILPSYNLHCSTWNLYSWILPLILKKPKKLKNNSIQLTPTLIQFPKRYQTKRVSCQEQMMLKRKPCSSNKKVKPLTLPRKNWTDWHQRSEMKLNSSLYQKKNRHNWSQK